MLNRSALWKIIIVGRCLTCKITVKDHRLLSMRCQEDDRIIERGTRWGRNRLTINLFVLWIQERKARNRVGECYEKVSIRTHIVQNVIFGVYRERCLPRSYLLHFEYTGSGCGTSREYIGDWYWGRIYHRLLWEMWFWLWRSR